MKKLSVMLMALALMVLAACGAATDVTYEMEEMGIKATVEMSAKGDKVQDQKVTMTFPYDAMGVESKEMAEEMLKGDIESESEELEGLKGVKVSNEFQDDQFEQVMEVNYKEADLRELEDAGFDFGEEESDYISLEKTEENLEEEGFKKVE